MNDDGGFPHPYDYAHDYFIYARNELILLKNFQDKYVTGRTYKAIRDQRQLEIPASDN